ncbi:MAG TPA: hypothetical protein VGO11_10505 [Chthoniobacteraceae bacterium]|jgi:uncharacterized membrane protein YphA (DoxX/SURF4 family)|nr:hypothetical protein [Chthoniobacteraceae bacterium]
MKIAATIVRVLLGLAFLLFGTMAFLMAFHFMPSQELPAGLAGDFNRALGESHYMLGVAAFEIVGGVLLLIGGRFTPLGLLLIGPVVVNIAFYHLFLDHDVMHAIPAVVVSVLSLFLLCVYRSAFAGLVRAS